MQQAKTLGFAEGHIDLFLKRRVVNPACIIEQREPLDGDSAIAKITSETGERTSLCLITDSYAGESCYQEYDEEQLCKRAAVSGQIISLPSATYPSEIELLVALCKKLHLTIFEIKPWVFSRYAGRYPLRINGKAVQIQIKKAVGTKLTCSDVYSDKEKIGEIYFS